MTITVSAAKAGHDVRYFTNAQGAAGAAGGGLRFGGELVAGCSPGSGRGCRADGARACAVLAGDVSGTDVGRSARRPRLPGRSGAVLDCRVDRRALSRES